MCTIWSRIHSSCGINQLLVGHSSPELTSAMSFSLRRWSSSARRQKLLLRRKIRSRITTSTRDTSRYEYRYIHVWIYFYYGALCLFTDGRNWFEANHWWPATSVWAESSWTAEGLHTSGNFNGKLAIEGSIAFFPPAYYPITTSYTGTE